MPSRYTLGSWYSRYWPYTSEEFRELVREYDRHGFPLDVLVMGAAAGALAAEHGLSALPRDAAAALEHAIDCMSSRTGDAASPDQA